MRTLLLAIGVIGAAIGAAVRADETAAKPSRHPPVLQSGGFVHIPGPTPAITPGPEGAWDGKIIESCAVLKEAGKYYWYYHGTGDSYQIGLATASGPLGPFTRYGDRPVLARGPKGSWDDGDVACAMVLRDAPGSYLMFYSGMPTWEPRRWGVGLATAPSPLGPWRKFRGNPIVPNYGYVGGVIKLGKMYWLYTEHPIDETAPDHGPISLVTAEKPEGPWTPYAENPVLKQGPPGTWDVGGFSESQVLQFGGIFHIFFGGCTPLTPRIASQESIGYAYSDDGLRFTKYEHNPVAPIKDNPNASAFSEVHTVVELPLIYCYHTLRYLKPWRPKDKAQFPGVEDLGIEVLATQRPFSFEMPLITRADLAARTTTTEDECPPLRLSSIRQASVTMGCRYSSQATKDLRVHVRSSRDGTHYEKADVPAMDLDLQVGQKAQKTFDLDGRIPYVKILIENPDPAQNAAEVSVMVKVKG